MLLYRLVSGSEILNNTKMSLRSFITPNVLRQSRLAVRVASGCRPLVAAPPPPLQRSHTTASTTQQTESFPSLSYQKMEVCLESSDWQPQVGEIARGTPSDPIVVDSLNEERLVGCVCDPESNVVSWIKLKQGTTSSCGSCGNCFRLQRGSP